MKFLDRSRFSSWKEELNKDLEWFWKEIIPDE